MFKIKPVIREKVRNKLKKIKGDTSHGGDHITGQAIKISSYFLETPLMITANKSIREGIFPKIWKKQITHLNHKKGDGTDPNHWRLVRHVHELGKIVESLVSDQLMEHFITNNLYHKSHHGGIRGLSTFTASAEIVERNFLNQEEGNLTGFLLVDQMSAYDVISHKILLKKMSCYNFDATTISWFGAYLSGRKNHVSVNSNLSEEIEIGEFGTKQGSVMGGTLFTIYSNDLPVGKEDQATDYVDDHADQCNGLDLLDLETNLQVQAK